MGLRSIFQRQLNSVWNLLHDEISIVPSLPRTLELPYLPGVESSLPGPHSGEMIKQMECKIKWV